LIRLSGYMEGLKHFAHHINAQGKNRKELIRDISQKILAVRDMKPFEPIRNRKA